MFAVCAGRSTSKSGSPSPSIASEVMLWGKFELLVTVSVPPLAMVRWLGVKARLSMVVGAEAGREGEFVEGDGARVGAVGLRHGAGGGLERRLRPGLAVERHGGGREGE